MNPVSGPALADIFHHVDTGLAADLADQVARRVAAERHHAAGLSWRAARVAAADSKGSLAVRSIIRAVLSRGGTAEQAVHDALIVARSRPAT